MLRERFKSDGIEFINAGVNGDLAYNVRQRIAAVIAQQPDYIIILVGTNDVTGGLSPRIGESMRSLK